MKRFILAIALATFPVASAQAPSQFKRFEGTWKNKPGGFIVSLKSSSDSIEGTVAVANPDRSYFTMDLANPTVEGNKLNFEALDGRTNPSRQETWYWTLTLSRNQKRGILHGAVHEMLLDVHVKRIDSKK